METRRVGEYRRLGQTDLIVSAIGFGCWEMGGTYGDISASEVVRAVQRAVDVGINCFDTAPAYGRGGSEHLLAQALGPRRKDVVIVTKCGVGYPERPKGRDSRRATVMASLEQSLRHLKTDYVDVLLIHWPDVTTPFEETMGALDEIVQQGKARYVGVSNFTLSQMQECMRTRRVDVVQYGLNMFDRRMEQEIFPFCQAEGIGVMVYGPLAYGLLAGAFTEETQFRGNDWRAEGNRMPALFLGLFAEGNFQRNVRAVNALKPLAERRGKKMPHLALRWVLSNPAVSVALAGMRSVQEVEDNLGALGWQLADAERAEIDAAFATYGINTAPEIWIDEP
jgi:aryl-alcohol dehydrogenase-like predicted oxidoreductase